MHHPGWTTLGPVLVRATSSHFPPTPDAAGLVTDTPEQWRKWLAQVWKDEHTASAITHASPTLAGRVEAWLAGRRLSRARARRLVAAVMRYLQRARNRPTPFGLFAGAGVAHVGEQTRVAWGDDRSVSTVSGAWVNRQARQAETDPGRLSHMSVVADATAVVEQDQLVVDQVGRPEGHRLSRTRQVRIGYSPPVETVMKAATTPVSWENLVEILLASHPGGTREQAEKMLVGLVWSGALLSSLRPPSTVSPGEHARRVLHATPQEGAPKGIDLVLSGDLTLPSTVGKAVGHAAALLEQLGPHCTGLPGWAGWADRFIDRYGLHTWAPVIDVLGPKGIGYPDWYTPAEPVLTPRDRWLLQAAQAAALDHKREIDPSPLAELTEPETPSVTHTELKVRVESPTPRALDAGRFRIAVTGVSRAALTMAGRMARPTGTVADLTAALDAATDQIPVQLSFPAKMARNAHVVRVPALCDLVVHIAEHPAPSGVGLEDLAIGYDDNGVSVWSHTLGCRVEPVVPHALRPAFAPPVARFLAELPRAHRTPMTVFSWGAAERLPFLPRVRSGRTVLSPARWRLWPGDLPGPSAPWPQWEESWHTLAERRHIPDLVEAGGGDERLHLDLSQEDHRFLLRTHLERTGLARLREAPGPTSFGWCAGRPTELLFQLTRGER